MQTKYYTINGKLRCAVLVASCSGRTYTNYENVKPSKTNRNEKVCA